MRDRRLPPPHQDTGLVIDTEVLTSALSVIMSASIAGELARRAIRDIGSLPAVLGSSDRRLAKAGFGKTAIIMLRTLSVEMRRSLATALRHDGVDRDGSVFREYVALSRAALNPGEASLFLFDKCQALTADIVCRSRDGHRDMPVFTEIASQARAARARSFMLLHRSPAGALTPFHSRLAMCCVAAGLAPYVPETAPVAPWSS
ncbi:hypothetical protein ACSMXM_09705 [Pacificimonas sp. ICDLI1SI03]